MRKLLSADKSKCRRNTLPSGGSWGFAMYIEWPSASSLQAKWVHRELVNTFEFVLFSCAARLLEKLTLSDALVPIWV